MSRAMHCSDWLLLLRNMWINAYKSEMYSALNSSRKIADMDDSNVRETRTISNLFGNLGNLPSVGQKP